MTESEEFDRHLQAAQPATLHVQRLPFYTVVVTGNVDYGSADDD